MRRRTRHSSGRIGPWDYLRSAFYIQIVYIIALSYAICQLKSASSSIYVYINGESVHQSSSSAKADDPVSTADYWIPAFRGYDDFCCGKSAAYFNAGNA